MLKKKLRRFIDGSTDVTTLLGVKSEIQGDIYGEGNFFVSGKVVGNSQVEGFLTVSADADWKGDIQAHSVSIMGVVEGAVSAINKVEIGPSAKVTGDISGAVIAVAEGASIAGALNMTTDNQVIHFKEKRTS